MLANKFNKLKRKRKIKGVELGQFLFDVIIHEREHEEKRSNTIICSFDDAVDLMHERRNSKEQRDKSDNTLICSFDDVVKLTHKIENMEERIIFNQYGVLSDGILNSLNVCKGYHFQFLYACQTLASELYLADVCNQLIQLVDNPPTILDNFIQDHRVSNWTDKDIEKALLMRMTMYQALMCINSHNIFIDLFATKFKLKELYKLKYNTDFAQKYINDLNHIIINSKYEQFQNSYTYEEFKIIFKLLGDVKNIRPNENSFREIKNKFRNNTYTSYDLKNFYVISSHFNIEVEGQEI